MPSLAFGCGGTCCGTFAMLVMAEHGRVWLVVALDHSVEAQRQVADRAMNGRSVVEISDVGGILIYLVEG